MSACPICPRKFQPILGDGPEPCPVLCIGERPGDTENRLGHVFVGKTGQEYDETYLPLAGLYRVGVRTTNVVKCFAQNNRTPSAKEILACASHFLPNELRRCQPEIVVLMGGSACSLVPGINLEMHHGQPRKASIFGWSGLVAPMYHPAIGLHEGRWMTTLLEDWEELRSFIEGGCQKLYEVRPPAANYSLVTDKGQIAAHFSNALWETAAAVDTESHGSMPYSVQISAKPHEAIMVLVGDKELISTLDFWLNSSLRTSGIVCHFAAHDLDVLAQLGIHPCRYRDTLQEAFHLGNLPQGLKPLVYRLFGVTMTSWEDIVWPASIRALDEWLGEALLISQADLCYYETKKLKTKVKEIVKSGPAERLITRLLKHSDEEGEYNPWQRLDEFFADSSNDWMTSHLLARVGHYPILGIGNCTLQDAVTYACGDADFTGQVAAELECRRQTAFPIDEGDRDL